MARIGHSDKPAVRQRQPFPPIAMKRFIIFTLLLALAAPALGQDFEEITPESEAALDAGLAWLAKNQGPKGNWESNDLGLVCMGALAFMAAGNAPHRGKYGKEVAKAL